MNELCQLSAECLFVVFLIQAKVEKKVNSIETVAKKVPHSWKLKSFALRANFQGLYRILQRATEPMTSKSED